MGKTIEKFVFDGDSLYKHTPLPQYGDGIAKVELVMTKEVFIECYNKWIKGNGVEDAESAETNDKCKACKNFDDLTQQCLRSECEEE